MSTASTALTMKVESGSPYQLNQEQVSFEELCRMHTVANRVQILKASTALLSHVKSAAKEASKAAGKQNLLEDTEVGDDTISEPIWLILTTKKHITDQKRLKPTRIAVPNPLNTSSTSKICLITADPQRTYKDIVASPAFPSELSSRIGKVVGIDKLKKKWSQYEA